MIKNIIITSLFIAAVILIRAIFRKKVSSRIIYALWLAVLLKLCLPFSFITIDLPDIPVFEKTYEEILSPITKDTVDIQEQEHPPANFDATEENTSPLYTDHSQGNNKLQYSDTNSKSNIKSYLILFWSIGGIIFLVVNAVFFLIFNVRLLKNRVYHSNIGNTKVYLCDKIISPCVAGIIPTIYINTLAATSDKLSLVLLHEKTHIKHGDHIWSVLRLLALSAYWWNPIVWVAALLSKRDSELACDETVIQAMKDDERLTYASMIIDMIPKKAGVAVGFSNSPIKERIDLLMKHNSKKLVPAILTLALVIILFGCANISDAEKTAGSLNNNSISNDTTVNNPVSDSVEVEETKDFKFSSVDDWENSENIKSVKQYKQLKINDTVSYEVILSIQERDYTLYISAPINYRVCSYPFTIHFPEILPFHESYASLFAANDCISISFIDYNSMELPIEQVLQPIDSIMEILGECSFINTENMFSTASGINSYVPFLMAEKYSENLKGISVIDAVLDMTAQHSLNDNSAQLLEYYLGGTPEDNPEAYSQRTAINYADSVKCPVLIMNYLQNPDFDVLQANDMKTAMNEAGGNCQVVTFDEINSDFHSDSASQTLIEFIDNCR